MSCYTVFYSFILKITDYKLFIIPALHLSLMGRRGGTTLSNIIIMVVTCMTVVNTIFVHPRIILCQGAVINPLIIDC